MGERGGSVADLAIGDCKPQRVGMERGCRERHGFRAHATRERTGLD